MEYQSKFFMLIKGNYKADIMKTYFQGKLIDNKAGNDELAGY